MPPVPLRTCRSPFETLSDTAEAESWRKEVHRPIYHVHKWWARRLGTVFRATVLAALAPSGSDVLRLFYEPTRFPGAVVFDPFMGSGTTIGEALKLGARAIGRDINPVAEFLGAERPRFPRPPENQSRRSIPWSVTPRLSSAAITRRECRTAGRRRPYITFG